MPLLAWALPLLGLAQSYVLTDSLIPADGYQNYLFGYEVALHKDRLVVGMPRDDQAAFGAGSAYIYHLENETWTLFQKLTMPNADPLDRFGGAVAIYEDYVLVSAQKDDVDGQKDQGSVYLYRLQPDSSEQLSYQLLQTFTAFDGVANDRFGRRLDLEHDFVAIGSRGDDENGEQSGSLYLYRRTESEPVHYDFWQKISPEDGAAHDRFSDYFLLEGEILIVGAAGDDIENDYDQGSAYLYRFDPNNTNLWQLEKKILANTASPAGEEFGNGIDLFGQYALVGAMTDSITGDSSGSAYIFHYKQGGAANWGQIQKLIPEAPIPGSRFGYNVALGKRVAVVGSLAIPKLGIPGYAYVFQQVAADNEAGQTWVQIQKIPMPAAPFQGKFANGIALDRDWLALGQRADTINEWYWHGSVQLYHLDLNSQVPNTEEISNAYQPGQMPLSATPNPVVDWVELQPAFEADLSTVEQVQLQLLDLQGRVVWQKDQIPNDQTHRFDWSAVLPGTYVLVQRNKQSLHSCVVLIQ